MGVIKQGILGGFSGKVANVVGSSWKGIAVIKSLPLSVANPNTSGQQAQRGAMTQIVIAARVMLASLLQPYWNPFAQRMSGYNAFVKENIATFATAGFTVFADFFSMRGSLLGITLVNTSATAGAAEVLIEWDDNSGTADALGTDNAVVVYYNSTQDYWVVFTGSAPRSAGDITIADTVMASGNKLQTYTSMARTDISKVSDSVYDEITVSA